MLIPDEIVFVLAATVSILLTINSVLYKGSMIGAICFTLLFPMIYFTFVYGVYDYMPADQSKLVLRYGQTALFFSMIVLFARIMFIKFNNKR